MKISALISILVLAFVVGLTLFSGSSVKNVLAHDNPPVDNGCNHTCPTVDWTYKYCPSGWDEVNNGDHEGQCKKKINNVWTYQNKTEGNTFHVAYIKSEDKSKCHRPSTDQLEDDYNMSHSEREAFTQENPQYLNTIDVAPDGSYKENGACYPKTPVCTDTTATNYGGADHHFDPEKEIADNSLCRYPEVTDVCPNIQGIQETLPQGYHFGRDEEDEMDICIADATPTVTITPTATPTVAPTDKPNTGGPGDGLSDGRSDGRSSCPECTKAPQTQVLGASTGPTQAVLGASTMAGTGTFAQNLMNVYAIFGMLLLTAGYKSYAKEKKLN